MDAIVRAVVVYFVLLVVLRIGGKRTLAQMTSFDLVLVLIIGETVEGALVSDDHSLTNAILLVLTLVGADLVVQAAKQRWKGFARWSEGSPLVVVEDGVMKRGHMERERVDEEDILEAARETHGLTRMDQVAHAVVERSGEISVIPKDER